MRTVILLCVAILLSGCAATQSSKTTTKYAKDGVTPIEQIEEKTPESPLGQSDYAKHVDGKTKHIEAEKDRIVGQSTSIAAIPCPASGEAAGWCGGMKVMAIGNLKPTEYGEGAPETAWGTIKSAVPYGVAGYAVKKMGDAVEVVAKNAKASFGDNATVTGSMNPVNPTTTNFGAGTATTGQTSGPAPPAEPIVVEPSYPPVM